MHGELVGYKDPVSWSVWLAILPVVLPLIISAVILMLRNRPKAHSVLAIGFMILTTILSFILLVKVNQEGPLVVAMGSWPAPFGIVFTVDSFGALMNLFAGIVGLAIAIFASQQTDNSERRFGFYTLFMLLMAGVQGSFLTGDLFNLYVWFEVMVIASFGLMILGGRHKQLDGGVKYAFLNLLATTFFLISVGLLYGYLGTLNMADIQQKLAAQSTDGPLLMIGVLMITAFLMKAAVFPLSFWLPASYHTPKIVVSALFAGLLTKAGAYALIRISVMLMPLVLSYMQDVLIIAGALTIIVGGLGAIAHTDIRRMSNYLVIAGIGNIIIGLALGIGGGLAGSILYAVHSMLVMTALYLVCGLIRVSGGSYDTHRVTSLYRRDPWLAGLFLALMFAIAGLPPFSGLWAKVYIVEAAVVSDLSATYLTVISVFSVLLGGFLSLLALGRVWIHMFWGERLPLAILPPPTADRTALYYQGGIPYMTAFFLVALSFAIGIFPAPLIDSAELAVRGLINPTDYILNTLGEGHH